MNVPQKKGDKKEEGSDVPGRYEAVEP